MRASLLAMAAVAASAVSAGMFDLFYRYDYKIMTDTITYHLEPDTAGKERDCVCAGIGQLLGTSNSARNALEGLNLLAHRAVSSRRHEEDERRALFVQCRCGSDETSRR